MLNALTGTAVQRRTEMAASGSTPREYRIVAFAMGVLIVHILVDAFLAPEPGTIWTDHILSATIPLGIIALAVYFYPRLRAGLRAVIDMTFGIWTITGAGVAIVDARNVGPRGDDWTGFLLLPGGLALLLLGALLLLRSRKRTSHRYPRRAALAFGALLAAYFVVWPVAFAIIATHKPRTRVVIGDLGHPSQAVTLPARDGLSLAGTYVQSQNGAAIILFPRQFIPVGHARMLARHGYGVLMIDMRGQGESEGDPNGWGWGSTEDLDAAISWLQARPDVDPARIGGLGLSVGGEQLIEAAAQNSGLAAIATEGTGWRSAREGMARHGMPRPQVWLQMVQDWMLTTATAILGGKTPPPSLSQLSSQIAPRPIFFMVGEHDNTLEAMLTPVYYAAAKEPRSLWTIPGAGHTGGLATQPQAYEQRVVDFFDHALLMR